MNELTQQALYDNAWNRFCDNIEPTLLFAAIFLICAAVALFIFWIGWASRGVRINKDFDAHVDKVVIQKMADKDAALDFKDEKITWLEEQLKDEKRRNLIIDEVKV
jgi:hypothetical protein